MLKRSSFLILLLSAVLMLCLAACSEHILPPKDYSPSEHSQMPRPTPTPTPRPFDGSITGVEINQGLSFGVEANTGDMYPMSDFVARRDTAVFVRLSEELGHVPDDRDYLEVYRGGELLGTYAPHELSTKEYLCYVLSGEDAAALEAGVYEFRAFVDGQMRSRSAELKETRAVRVLMIPVLGHFAGGSKYPAEGWQNYAGHLSACWPIANDGLQLITAPGLDLSNEQYNLGSSVGMWRAWEALRERAGLIGDYDLIVGLVSGSMGEGGNCDSFGRDGIVLVNTNQTAPEAAITHFAGHVFGAGDEYENGLFAPEVNPAPYGVRGIDAVTGAEISTSFRGVEKASVYEVYCGGSVVHAEQIPFDISQQRLLGDAASFMGDAQEYTHNYWITSALWEHLFDALQLREDAQNEAELPAGSTHFLRVSGLLGQDGSRIMRETLEIAGTEVQHSDWNAPSGAYKLSFADADGKILRSFFFTPDYRVLTDPPGMRTLAPFTLDVPVPAGAALLQIYGSKTMEDGSVESAALLYESRLESRSFESVFTSLPSADQMHGIVRVEWTTVMDQPEVTDEKDEKDEEEEKSEPIQPYYELYMNYEGGSLLLYRGALSSAELDTLSMPKTERFTLTVLSCIGGRVAVAESEELQL